MAHVTDCKAIYCLGAVILCSFVGIYLQLFNEGTWGWGAAAVLQFIAFGLAFRAGLGRSNGGAIHPQPQGLPTQPRFIAPLIVGIGMLVHCYFMLTYPLWLSEAMILDDAAAIGRGEFPNPLSYTGDFPVRLMPYLVASLYPFVPDVRIASRALGAIAIIGFCILVWRTSRLIAPNVPSVVLVFPIFSIWLINLSNTADNNWLSFVPLLSLAPFSAFLWTRSTPQQIPSRIPLLAACVAASIWSLYMPAIAGLAVTFFVLLDPHFTNGNKGKFLLWLLFLCGPLLAYIAESPSRSLGRHANFVMQHGEGSLNTSLLDGYLRTVARITDYSIPDLGQSLHPNRILFLEPSTLLLFVAGLLLAPFMARSNRGSVFLLYAFAAICLGGLVVSNPVESFWRTSVLAPSFFLFVILGFFLLLSIRSPWLKLSLSYSILFTHLGLFAFYYSNQIAYQRSLNRITGEAFALHCFSSCLQPLSSNSQIEVPHDFPTFVPRVMSRGRFSEKHADGKRFVTLTINDTGETLNYRIVRLIIDQPTTPNPATICNVLGPGGQTIGSLERTAGL